MSRSDICGIRLTMRPEEYSTMGSQTNKVETPRMEAARQVAADR